MSTPPEFGANPLAIVTGGAKRIGAAFVRALAADGWRILIHYSQSAAEADEMAAEIGAETVQADLADPQGPARVIAAAQGRARLLVNSASNFRYDDLASFGADGFDAHVAVNLRAPALLTQSFAAALPADARGLIVNMVDAKLQAMNPDYFTYTLAKAGLAALTELAARALAPRIRVNAIAPSVTLVSGPQSRENFDAVHANNALERGVEVDDLVGALRFLIASPAITAHTIQVDGGMRLMGFTRDVAYL